MAVMDHGISEYGHWLPVRTRTRASKRSRGVKNGITGSMINGPTTLTYVALPYDKILHRNARWLPGRPPRSIPPPTLPFPSPPQSPTAARLSHSDPDALLQ
jgi:hypothetical protein